MTDTHCQHKAQLRCKFRAQMSDISDHGIQLKPAAHCAIQPPQHHGLLSDTVWLCNCSSKHYHVVSPQLWRFKLHRKISVAHNDSLKGDIRWRIAAISRVESRRCRGRHKSSDSCSFPARQSSILSPAPSPGGRQPADMWQLPSRTSPLPGT